MWPPSWALTWSWFPLVWGWVLVGVATFLGSETILVPFSSPSRRRNEKKKRMKKKRMKNYLKRIQPPEAQFKRHTHTFESKHVFHAQYFPKHKAWQPFARSNSFPMILFYFTSKKYAVLQRLFPSAGLTCYPVTYNFITFSKIYALQHPYERSGQACTPKAGPF